MAARARLPRVLAAEASPGAAEGCATEPTRVQAVSVERCDVGTLLAQKTLAVSASDGI